MLQATLVLSLITANISRPQTLVPMFALLRSPWPGSDPEAVSLARDQGSPASTIRNRPQPGSSGLLPPVLRKKLIGVKDRER